MAATEVMIRRRINPRSLANLRSWQPKISLTPARVHLGEIGFIDSDLGGHAIAQAFVVTHDSLLPVAGETVRPSCGGALPAPAAGQEKCCAPDAAAPGEVDTGPGTT